MRSQYITTKLRSFLLAVVLVSATSQAEPILVKDGEQITLTGRIQESHTYDVEDGRVARKTVLRIRPESPIVAKRGETFSISPILQTSDPYVDQAIAELKSDEVDVDCRISIPKPRRFATTSAADLEPKCQVISVSRHFRPSVALPNVKQEKESQSVIDARNAREESAARSFDRKTIGKQAAMFLTSAERTKRGDANFILYDEKCTLSLGAGYLRAELLRVNLQGEWIYIDACWQMLGPPGFEIVVIDKYGTVASEAGSPPNYSIVEIQADGSGKFVRAMMTWEEYFRKIRKWQNGE